MALIPRKLIGSRSGYGGKQNLGLAIAGCESSVGIEIHEQLAALVARP